MHVSSSCCGAGIETRGLQEVAQTAVALSYSDRLPSKSAPVLATHFRRWHLWMLCSLRRRATSLLTRCESWCDPHSCLSAMYVPEFNNRYGFDFLPNAVISSAFPSDQPSLPPFPYSDAHVGQGSQGEEAERDQVPSDAPGRRRDPRVVCLQERGLGAQEACTGCQPLKGRQPAGHAIM